MNRILEHLGNAAFIAFVAYLVLTVVIFMLVLMAFYLPLCFLSWLFRPVWNAIEGDLHLFGIAK